MCGRFNLRTSVSQIAQIFLPGFDPSSLPTAEPRYNIAPTQPILCVVDPGAQEQNTARRLTYFRWGLIPPWAKEMSIGNSMINARGETVAEKRSFKPALKSRRCIIPVDGYYEWLRTETGKQPYEFSAATGGLLALAGLWEKNKIVSDNAETVYTCTIITTGANEFMAEIHDRMPVILPTSSWEQWLDPEFTDIEAAQKMLHAAPNDLLVKRPVSRKLNNVRNQGAELLRPDE